METKIAFEHYLFRNQGGETYSFDDIDFLVDRILVFPSIRPLELEKVVELCLKLVRNNDFKRKLLEKGTKCIVIIYQMFKNGVFIFEEIEPFIKYEKSCIPFYYFRKDINNFGLLLEKKQFPDNFFRSFFQNEDLLNQMIEYGFLPSSVEYCLKYDDCDVLHSIGAINQKDLLWSPFEWSLKPDYLDILSFSGFFGSIRCFRYLLFNGYHINNKVRLMVICSGSMELYHLCCEKSLVSPEFLFLSSKYNLLFLLEYFVENGGDVNVRDKTSMTPLHIAAQDGHHSIVEYLVTHGANVDIRTKSHEIYYFLGLLFFTLLKMGIVVLLSC